MGYKLLINGNHHLDDLFWFTPPKTNSLPLKNDSLENESFLLGPGGEELKVSSFVWVDF